MTSMYEQNKITNEIKFLELQRQREQFELLFYTTEMSHTRLQAYKDFNKSLAEATSSLFRQLTGEYKKTDECFSNLEEIFEEL